MIVLKDWMIGTECVEDLLNKSLQGRLNLLLNPSLISSNNHKRRKTKSRQSGGVARGMYPTLCGIYPIRGSTLC